MRHVTVFSKELFYKLRVIRLTWSITVSGLVRFLNTNFYKNWLKEFVTHGG
jgi:hypothetical protein